MAVNSIIQTVALLGRPQVSFFDYLVFTANCNFSGSGAPHNYFMGVGKQGSLPLLYSRLLQPQ